MKLPCGSPDESEPMRPLLKKEILSDPEKRKNIQSSFHLFLSDYQRKIVVL
jgi:hypothetical protein